MMPNSKNNRLIYHLLTFSLIIGLLILANTSVMAIYQQQAFDFIASTNNTGDLDDATILAIYDQVNRFDIATAKLALKKTRHKEIRRLAGMVKQDHQGVRHTIKKLAREIDVTPLLPSHRQEAEKQHKETITPLKKLSRTEFDSAYLRHEINFHTAAIQAVNGILLPAATHPVLIQHFHDVLPAFEHHLAETKRIATELEIDY